MRVGMWGAEKGNRKRYGQLGLTALLAAGLFLLLFAIRQLYPLGKGSISMIDLYSQYTPLLYRFYDVATGQKNLFMDLSVSGGANLYADTINEMINPFNYLLLLLGRARIYQGVNLLLACYVTAAAVAANFLLLRLWPESRRGNCILSLAYAFSGFAAYNFQIIKWMYLPVLFPFFVLALRRLLRGKGGWPYALLLGYQLALSLQLGFMVLLATLFGSGFYFFFRRRTEGKREDRRAMGRLGCYTLAGVGLSWAVLYPNILYLLDSARAGENLSYWGVMKRHGLEDLFERIFQIFHPVLAALLVWALGRVECLRFRDLWRRRKNLGQFWRSLGPMGKFLSVWNLFLWVTVLAQPSNLLWHLGGYMCFPVRYGYMVLLSEVCLVKWWLVRGEAACKDRARFGDKAGQGSTVQDSTVQDSTVQDDASQSNEERGSVGTVKRAVWHGLCGLGAILAASLALYITLREQERLTQAFSSLAISATCPAQAGLVCALLLLLTGAALLALGAAKAERALLAAVTGCCGLVFFLFILLPQDYEVRRENEAAYERMNAQYGQGRNGKEEEKTGFWRMPDDATLPLNAALVNGSASMTGYFPAGSPLGFARSMERLGYLTPWVSIRSHGGTLVSDGMLGILRPVDERVCFPGGLVLDRGPEPLAAEYEALEREGPLALQNYLSALLTGRELFCLTGSGGAGVGKESLGQDSLSRESFGQYSLCLAVESRQALYLDAGRPAQGLSVEINGEEIALPEGFLAESPHRLLFLGIFENQEVRVRVKDNAGNLLAVETLRWGLLDLEAWQESAVGLAEAGHRAQEAAETQSLTEAQNPAGMQNATVPGPARAAEGSRGLPVTCLEVDAHDAMIRVDIRQLAPGETLFLPVAAIEGWHCLEDGKETEITPVLGGFLGIDTQNGAEEAVFYFLPPGIEAGVALLACILLWMLCGQLWKRVFCKKPGKRRVGQSALLLEKAGEICFWAVWVSALFIVYVAPNIGLVFYMGVRLSGR